MSKRILSAVSTCAAVALGIAVFAAVEPGGGSAADDAAIPASVKAVVEQAREAPHSPLLATAATQISKVDSQPGGQTFYRVPTADGGSCLVTSTGLLSSCLTNASRHPGTVTLTDDASDDDRPGIVFGQTIPGVTAVRVIVAGGSGSAELGDGVYSFALPTAETTLDDVKKVQFRLTDGRTVTRVIHP